MHVGIDISVLRIAQAGVLRYTHTLIEHLVAQGQQHHWTLLDVLPLNPDKPTQARLQALDAPHVDVVRCLGLKRRYISQHPAARAGLLHRAASRLDDALDRPWALAGTAAVGLQLWLALRDVALFHSSDQFFYTPPQGAALLTIHDLTTLVHPEFHAQANAAMHSAKERFAVEQADHIIAVSQATKRDITQHLGIPAERISVVYEAADTRFRVYRPDQIQAVLDRYRLRSGHYILTVGTLEPRKNHVRLIESYAALCSQLGADHPDLPPLVIAGGFGWLYEDILAAPERFGVAQRVRMLGKVPDADLPQLIAGARLFVYPSLYEGFGLPVLEALACGTPVVASNTSSIPEVLADAGLYCDPRATASIAKSIAVVLLNPMLIEQLRHAGPRRAASFSWERTAQETLGVYARVRGEWRSRRKKKWWRL